MADANELLYKVEYESYLHTRIESEEHVRSVWHSTAREQQVASGELASALQSGAGLERLASVALSSALHRPRAAACP